MTHDLDRLRDLIQTDIGQRGLARDPRENLFTACREDFVAACRHLAATPAPAVAVVTGFFIPTADPPCGETDGPLGAVFLARALVSLGIPVVIITDPFYRRSVEVGLEGCGIGPSAASAPSDPGNTVSVLTIPPSDHPWEVYLESDWSAVIERYGLTHLIALERVGPAHADGRCRSMRGRDITDHTHPAHLLFEATGQPQPRLTTIGIGDGGNEIGMGKVPWDVVRRNIPNGHDIACRVPTDHLIVAGISNWGAYALAAGVLHLRRAQGPPGLFDGDREEALLRVMVAEGPLVDGVTGQQTATVDGLAWDDYARPLQEMGRILGEYA